MLSAVGLDGDPGEFHAPAGELVDAFDETDVDIVAQSERDGVGVDRGSAPLTASGDSREQHVAQRLVP